MTTESLYGFSIFPQGSSLDRAIALSAPATETAAEILPVPEWPNVRVATHADLPSLVEIELAAYSDVYGSDPKQEVVEEVQNRYRERIDLLGDYVRVVEDGENGVYGMVVSCPIGKNRDYFLSNSVDMTSNETLKKVYDPKGKNAYVVNLAIHPKAQGRGEHLRLLADTIQFGAEAGIERAFFESRLPGFKRWVSGSQWFANKMKVAEKIQVPPPSFEELGKMFPNEVNELAETYWRLTEVRDGVEKPKDSLLRLYTDFGCEPLRLIREAWKPDASSAGFGVLCEYQVPNDNKSAEQKASFMANVLAGIKMHKKGLAIGGTALVAFGYSISSEGVDEILESATWALPAYLGSWALIISGGAMMLSAAGQEINLKNLIKNPKDELKRTLTELPENNLARAGFWINAVGAVAAAGVVIGTAVKALPIVAAAAAAAPAIADLYSTIVTRYAAHKWAKNDNTSAK